MAAPRVPKPIEDHDPHTEAIVGWRVWNLADDPTYGLLLIPAGSGGGEAWWPGYPQKARCSLPWFMRLGKGGSHEAPDPRCTCGLYATQSLEVFERPRPAWPPPPVVGTVSMWGRVVEHRLGWRSQFAYPARLRLVCSMCAWFEPGPGNPVVVHTVLGQLYTLCEKHRGGIQLADTRVTKLTDIDPNDLQTRLLDRYGVELLPFELVETLFNQPPTPEPPGWRPSIHPVPYQE
jgi:hypothetical protein